MAKNVAINKKNRTGIKTCPTCGKDINLQRLPMPRYSKKAIMLFVAAAVVSFVWIGILLTWSPVFLVPRSGAGIIICAVVYLGPGLVMGVIAASLPKIRTFSCRYCGWKTEVPQ